MEILDIVQSAAFKSGIVSSFSRDDMPGDVLDAGVKLLSGQILPQLNCDRTIDITTTCRMYTPVNGTIVLNPLRQPINDFVLLGYSKYNSNDLSDIQNNNWQNEIERLHPGWRNNWPVNDFGEPLTLAMWSLDMRLVSGQSILACNVGSENIDFMPMRVDAVIEPSTGLKLTYLYRDEFEQTISAVPSVPGIFAIEEYDDKIIVLVRGMPGSKKLVLPVPLTIINQSQTDAGTIVAPPKFRKYLIDATAVQLAIVYGVSTVDSMKAEAAASYNMLKKNHTQPLHKMSAAKSICETLRESVYDFSGYPWRL